MSIESSRKHQHLKNEQAGVPFKRMTMGVDPSLQESLFPAVALQEGGH